MYGWWFGGKWWCGRDRAGGGGLGVEYGERRINWCTTRGWRRRKLLGDWF
jgi:hypothetical protein